MGYETLKYEKDGHVAILTIDRPEKLNALSLKTMQELPRVLDEANADSDVRCLVITGAGDRAFSTGFDLDGLEMATRTDLIREAVECNFNVLMKVWNLRIPSLAAVNGYAVAAGSNLAMICDVTIASDRAKFGEPEVRHFALSPMMLQPWFNGNPKMIHYLYFTGDTITAPEALSLGMIAKVVPHEQLMDEAMRMARRIALVPAYSLHMTKDSLRRTYEAMGFLQAMHYHKANDTLVLSATGIPEKDHFFDLMAAGDMKAFLEARDGPFKRSR
jgi:enoyl-CoA hydratase/carnithine racemase